MASLFGAMKNHCKVGNCTVDIMNIIGKGAFGIVYKGTNKQKEAIAAKRIDVRERHRDKTSMLVNNMQTLLFLNHDNIVRIVDVVKQGELTTWILMEYCCHGDLNAYFSKRPDVSESEMIKLMLDTARGLQYLHEMDIIHRDVKPENILVGGDKQIKAKLTDFDLSKILEEGYDTSAMSSNVGTPVFKAPEFFMRDSNGKLRYHRNVDIYALALTYLAMIQRSDSLIPRIETAQDASEARVPIGSLIAERIRFKVQPLEILDKTSSAGSKRINEIRLLISRMTPVDPTARLSASAVVRALHELLAEVPVESFDSLSLTGATAMDDKATKVRLF